jgi:copper chaperone CopZ
MLNLFKKKPQGKEVTFIINGMHCTSCALNIDGELEDTPGVVSASTSYAKASTTVVFDDKKVNEKKLQQAIKNAGYDSSLK